MATRKKAKAKARSKPKKKKRVARRPAPKRKKPAKKVAKKSARKKKVVRKKVVKKKTVKKKSARKSVTRAKPAARKPSPKPATASVPENERLVGKVTHYFSHLSVAVVQLETGTLREGDTIHIKGHTSDFYQRVASMEVDHVHVAEARPGQSFGLKVSGHAREHDGVYRVVA